MTHFRMAFVFFMAGCAALAQDAKLDSVEQMLPGLRDDSAKVHLMARSAVAFGRFNPTRMKRMANAAVQLADRLGDKVALGHALYALGEALESLDSSVGATRAYQQSLDAYSNAHFRQGRILPLLSLANMVFYYGSKERSLVYATEGLILSRKDGDANSEAAFFMLISQHNLVKKDTRRAIEYMDSASEAYARANRPARTAYCLIQAGHLLNELGEYERTLPLVNRAVSLLLPMHDYSYLTFGYTLMAVTYRLSGKLDSARVAIRHAQEQADLQQQDRFFAIVAEERGHLALACGDTVDAISQYQRAKGLYSPDIDRENIAELSNTLSRLHASRQQYALAYSHLLTSATIIDSVLRSEMRRQVDEVTTRYENEKTEQAIGALEKDKALQNLELMRQREVIINQRIQAEQRARLLDVERARRLLETASAQTELARKNAETARQKQALVALDKDRLLGKSELRRETLTRNVSIAGVILLIVAFVFLTHRYRERKRMTTQLQSTLDTLQRTQSQLIHSEKMATLGEMTAGIAHEIKNPLNFVTNFSSLSEELSGELGELVQRSQNGLSETERAEMLHVIGSLLDNTRKVTEHGKRADTIIANMMMHARRESGVRQPVDINRLVDDAVQLADSGQKASVRDAAVLIKTQYDPNAGEIEVLPQEISRVVLNLVSNAIYAARTSAPPPVPPLRGGEPRRVEGAVWVSTARRNGVVEIRVRDNGPGVPAEIRDKIFQPFFTTKPTGEGTGLGLSMSYDIVVHGHGGSLACTSNGSGADFIVTLPLRGATT